MRCRRTRSALSWWSGSRGRGAEAQVYRGYEQDDPESEIEGTKMCRDLAAVQDAKKAGCKSIRPSVCERKDRTTGEVQHCSLLPSCGMTRQRLAKPQVWIVPHALLMHKRSSFIQAPDALVIDEGFLSGAIPDKPFSLSLDTMERSDFTIKSGTALAMSKMNDLEILRKGLIRALRAHDGDGPLQREILAKHGVTVASAERAHTLEWMRWMHLEIVPGMQPDRRHERAEETGGHNAEVRAWTGFWAELRAFLEAGAPASGRLRLRYDPEKGCRVLERRSLGTVHKSWKAPALLLDATLPDPVLLEPVLGHKVEIKADITAPWSTYGRVRQIIGAPVSASKLGIVKGKEPGTEKRVIDELMRLITLRAALVGRDRIVAVIGQKILIEKLKDLGLPENVETGHFNAVAGLDHWKGAAGLICIGRPLPDPRTVETEAGIVTGAPPMPAPTENGFTWYERVTRGIRLASGEGAAVEWYRHPDPIAEALRWLACEANLIQAIGRLRALRRKDPFFLDIVCAPRMPISVDEVTPWRKACPGRWAEMACEGVLLSSPADILAAYPDLASSRKAARGLEDLSLAPTFIKDLSIDVGANVTAVTYKRRGRYTPTSALVLPNGPEDLKGWLETRLGPIEWVQAEEEAKQAQDVSRCEKSHLWALSIAACGSDNPAGDTNERGGMVIFVHFQRRATRATPDPDRHIFTYGYECKAA